MPAGLVPRLRERQGQIVGAAERLTARRALDAHLGSPAAPGAPADLLLMRVPLAEALARLASDHVAVALVNGRVVHSCGWARPVFAEAISARTHQSPGTK
ncbi:hypothetical protein ACIRVK_27455 [Streptomyces sp. NPDC101152]|uniref:hypothetical protein n=1 Tax=Streptomyces sp. NPDC101152 TaxID=3366116 RepID=UPI0037FA1BD5